MLSLFTQILIFNFSFQLTKWPDQTYLVLAVSGSVCCAVKLACQAADSRLFVMYVLVDGTLIAVSFPCTPSTVKCSRTGKLKSDSLILNAF